jgi:hypothetical protein
MHLISLLARESSVGIAILKGIDGPAVVGEILSTPPDRPWGPTSFLYNEYQIPSPVKQSGGGVNHLPKSITEVKERVEPYPYSPSDICCQF